MIDTDYSGIMFLGETFEVVSGFLKEMVFRVEILAFHGDRGDGVDDEHS